MPLRATVDGFDTPLRLLPTGKQARRANPRDQPYLFGVSTLSGGRGFSIPTMMPVATAIAACDTGPTLSPPLSLRRHPRVRTPPPVPLSA